MADLKEKSTKKPGLRVLNVVSARKRSVTRQERFESVSTSFKKQESAVEDAAYG